MAHAEIFGKLACKCEKCGHVWFSTSRPYLPTRCSKCKSPYWDVARATGVVIQNKEAAARLLADARGETKFTPAEVNEPSFGIKPEEKAKKLVGGAGMMFPKDKWKQGGAKKAKWKKGAK